MNLTIASDLEIAGYNIEFADIDNPRGTIYREVFWVQATLEDGTRYDHHFITRDITKAKALLDRMQGKELALDNSNVWAIGTPVYGSQAYLLYGGEETLRQLEI